MNAAHRHVAGLKMCLNHSQSGIEEALLELECDFRAWMEHPQQRASPNKVVEHLVNFRWILDQHFTRVAGEGYLENVASLRPGMYGDLREIECRQCQVIDDLDRLIARVRQIESHRESNGPTLSDLFNDFRRLHSEILDEESLERLLVEKALA